MRKYVILLAAVIFLTGCNGGAAPVPQQTKEVSIPAPTEESESAEIITSAAAESTSAPEESSPETDNERVIILDPNGDEMPSAGGVPKGKDGILFEDMSFYRTTGNNIWVKVQTGDTVRGFTVAKAECLYEMRDDRAYWSSMELNLSGSRWIEGTLRISDLFGNGKPNMWLNLDSEQLKNAELPLMSATDSQLEIYLGNADESVLAGTSYDISGGSYPITIELPVRAEIGNIRMYSSDGLGYFRADLTDCIRSNMDFELWDCDGSVIPPEEVTYFHDGNEQRPYDPALVKEGAWIECEGRAWLIHPSMEDTRRFDVGDKVCGLTLAAAKTVYGCMDGVSWLNGGRAEFDGEIKVVGTARRITEDGFMVSKDDVFIDIGESSVFPEMSFGESNRSVHITGGYIGWEHIIPEDGSEVAVTAVLTDIATEYLRDSRKSGGVGTMGRIVSLAEADSSFVLTDFDGSVIPPEEVSFATDMLNQYEYDPENVAPGLWIELSDRVWLTDPSDGKIKRYGIGDTVCGLNVTMARTIYERTNEISNKTFFNGGQVMFSGAIEVTGTARRDTRGEFLSDKGDIYIELDKGVTFPAISYHDSRLNRTIHIRGAISQWNDIVPDDGSEVRVKAVISGISAEYLRDSRRSGGIGTWGSIESIEIIDN